MNNDEIEKHKLEEAKKSQNFMISDEENKHDEEIKDLGILSDSNENLDSRPKIDNIDAGNNLLPTLIFYYTKH